MQNVQRKPAEFQADFNSDVHENSTMQNVEITKSNDAGSNNKEDKFSFSQCQAYETHKLPGSNIDRGSSFKKTNPMENTGSQVHGRGMNPIDCEDGSNHPENNVEDTYEVIQGNK